MRHTQIIIMGSHFPKQVVTNAEFASRFGDSVSDWLIENVGIRERRFMREDQTTSDLAVTAGEYHDALGIYTGGIFKRLYLN